jgi:hypothetical protein
VIYDAGTVYGTGLISVTIRLAFDRTTTRRELEIIGTDLHCNAVRIVTDPVLATWPWLSGKQTTPVMPLNMRHAWSAGPDALVSPPTDCPSG